MTVAFMKIIHATMQAYGTVLPTSSANEFCDTHPHLLHKTVMRLFYSPRGRDLEAEEHGIVEPDLCPLPRYEPPADD